MALQLITACGPCTPCLALPCLALLPCLAVASCRCRACQMCATWSVAVARVSALTCLWLRVGGCWSIVGGLGLCRGLRLGLGFTWPPSRCLVWTCLASPRLAWPGLALSLALWPCGLVALWPCGLVALWPCGLALPCLVSPSLAWPCLGHGLVDLWLRGLVALWPFGLVALWLCLAWPGLGLGLGLSLALVALWPSGLVALCPYGLALPCLASPGLAWPRLALALRPCGLLALWPCGLVALWPCGLVALWRCGLGLALPCATIVVPAGTPPGGPGGPTLVAEEGPSAFVFYCPFAAPCIHCSLNVALSFSNAWVKRCRHTCGMVAVSVVTHAHASDVCPAARATWGSCCCCWASRVRATWCGS